MITFLGLEIDSPNQLVRVPQDKVVALLQSLQQALDKDYMTLPAIQSLLGSLNFVCRAVVPGRAFLRRLIDLTVGVTDKDARIRVGAGERRDINMWISFLRGFNGAAMFLDSNWISNSTLELYTDAAQSIGFGCYFQGHWTQGKWPQDEVAHQKSIAWLELFPLVVSLGLWGQFMANRRVKFWTDNQAVVAIINRQTAKCPAIMELVRKFVLLALRHNVVFKAAYIAGKMNGISDSLSRFQEDRFRQLAPEADAQMTPLPQWAQ